MRQSQKGLQRSGGRVVCGRKDGSLSNIKLVQDIETDVEMKPRVVNLDEFNEKAGDRKATRKPGSGTDQSADCFKFN